MPNNTPEPNWEELYADPQMRAIAQAKFKELQEEINDLESEKQDAEQEISLLKKAWNSIAGGQKRADSQIQEKNQEIQKLANSQTATPAPAPKPAPAAAPAPKPEPKPKPKPTPATAPAPTDDLATLKQKEKALREDPAATAADIAKIQQQIKELEPKPAPTPKPTPKPEPTKPAATIPAKPTPQPVAPQPTPATAPAPAPKPVPPAPTPAAEPQAQISSPENRLYRTEKDIIDALGVTDKGQPVYTMGRDEYEKLKVVKGNDNSLWLVFGSADDPNNPYVANFSPADLTRFPGLLEATVTILTDQNIRNFTPA